MPISPWAADSLTHIRDAPIIEPIYSVTLLPYLAANTPVVPPAGLATVPAWNVTVAFDGGRTPYGVATFSAPLDYVSAVATGGYQPLAKLTPYVNAPVLISAGYRRGGTTDIHPVFAGYVTKRRVRKASDGSWYVEFEAETSETCYDYPSNRAGNVGNTWTSIKQACDTINGYSSPWLAEVLIVEEAGRMNTPTSAQLAAWRAWEYQIGDNIADTLVLWATALGQWLRGDPRATGTWGARQMLISADPYPYRAITTLPTSMFATLDRDESADRWANLLNLSVSWSDPSNGDTKSKRRAYDSNARPGLIRAKDVSVRAYPPSGALPASYPLATAWLRRIGPMQEVQYTGASRAMYWLQPRIDGVVLSDDPYGDAAGPIDAITWQLDTGTQTMTWTADAAY